MRRYLLVTEKFTPGPAFQDGGHFLVQTLKNNLGDALDIMQFGEEIGENNPFVRRYSSNHSNRFFRRIQNAGFIADQVSEICHRYSDIIFIHASMLFGFKDRKPDKICFWTFPMFLTPSYIHSGETVPFEYTELESHALKLSDRLICPSYFERNQIAEHFKIPKDEIKVIPRGLNKSNFTHSKRQITDLDKLVFASIGSIKRQKNTVGLLKIFYEIRKTYPNAFLKIIGPIQDEEYYQEVVVEISNLNLKDNMELLGHIDPSEMNNALEGVHIHLSASTCETFGRAIFESIASGIPNICRKSNNAAYDFLSPYPFAWFYSNESEIPDLLQRILKHYEMFSAMASEIGTLFDNELLGNLLITEICSKETIVIADFDGTLYHKNDKDKTSRCVSSFNKYPCRIICSSRSLNDINNYVQELNLAPDYIIAFSGGLIVDAYGKILWLNEMEENDVISSETQVHENIFPSIFENRTIQYYTNATLTENLPYNIRTEVYQNTTFISKWNITKLSAIQKLLQIINRNAKIICFGDSKYDFNFLTFYDGYLMNNSIIEKSAMLKSTCEII